MNAQQLKKRRWLFGAALLAAGLGTSFAGEVFKAPELKPAPDKNPLTFGIVTFDLQERLRAEVRENNFDFDEAVNSLTDDSWLLQRFRIGALIKPAAWLKLYGQGQDSREINSDRPDTPGSLGAEGDDSFDLRQAYVELGDPKSFPLLLKVGRQMLSYGDERMIGGFDWNNIGRTFDAVKLRWEEKNWWLDAFASSVVVANREQINRSDFADGNETDRDQIFSGLYFSTTALKVQTTELYALHLHENSNEKFLPTAAGDTNFATFGLRIKSKPGAFAQPAASSAVADGKTIVDGKSAPPSPAAPKPVGFDYDTELAFQTGEVRGLDLTAFALHGGLGYTFDTFWNPRLGAEYNYGTGDSDPGDAQIETFQNLFPTNHKFYGYMDVFSWQNLHNPAVSLRVAPAKSISVQLDYHGFWLASTDDVWYRANGTTAVRPLTPGADNFAGSELDLTITWNAAKYLVVQAGYSHFFAGDYLAATGASDDADFGYIMATLTF